MKVGFDWCCAYAAANLFMTALVGQVCRLRKYEVRTGEVYNICSSAVLFIMLGATLMDDSVLVVGTIPIILVAYEQMLRWVFRYVYMGDTLEEGKEDGVYCVRLFGHEGRNSIYLGDILDILEAEGVNFDGQGQSLQVLDISQHVPRVRAMKIAHSAKPEAQPHGQEAYLEYAPGRLKISSKPSGTPSGTDKILPYRSGKNGNTSVSAPVRACGNLALGETVSEVHAKTSAEKVVISPEELRAHRKLRELPEEDRKLVLDLLRKYEWLTKYILSPVHTVPISFIPATDTTPRRVKIHGIVYHGRV